MIIEGERFIAQEGEAVAHSSVDSSTGYGNPGVAFGRQGTRLSWALHGCLVGQEGKAYLVGQEEKAYRNRMVGEVDGI